MDRNRINELIALREQIDAELASNGIHMKNGKPMVNIHSLNMNNGQNESHISDISVAKAEKILMDIPGLNGNRPFPGWLSRLQNDDY